LTGTELKSARENAQWTQQQAASGLGLTQAYLSMVEGGLRPVSNRLASRVLKVFDFPPTALPLEPEELAAWKKDELPSDLGRLGYPGFGFFRGKPRRNPAELLFHALRQSDLDARIVAALPWLTATYVDMDWNWLVSRVKLDDRQNRLGFVVAIAGELAGNAGDDGRSKQLSLRLASLEQSRLVKEDTLCHDSMTKAERNWLRKHRPLTARHWNLLTDLEVRHLAFAPL